MKKKLKLLLIFIMLTSTMLSINTASAIEVHDIYIEWDRNYQADFAGIYDSSNYYIKVQVKYVAWYDSNHYLFSVGDFVSFYNSDILLITISFMWSGGSSGSVPVDSVGFHVSDAPYWGYFGLVHKPSPDHPIYYQTTTIFINWQVETTGPCNIKCLDPGF